MKRPRRPQPPPPSLRLSVCIIAGGLSSRMGREKSRLRLGRRSLLGHVRAAAQQLGCPVRVIRRDLVPRCGPLGGIYTALRHTRADAVLFLACDMPFVSPGLLCSLPRLLRQHTPAITITLHGKPGFPLLLRSSALPVVADQLQRGRRSLHALVRTLKAEPLELPTGRQAELLNVNTPEDWALARRQYALLTRSERGRAHRTPDQAVGNRSRRNSRNAPLVKAPGHR